MFEIFSNFLTTGKFSSESTSDLFTNHYFLINQTTFLFGGQNPDVISYSKVGRTDVGIMREIASQGVFLSIIYYILGFEIFVKLIKKLNRCDKSLSLWMVIVFLMTMILEFKANAFENGYILKLLFSLLFFLNRIEKNENRGREI